MRQKWTALILALALTASLTACGGADAGGAASGSGSVVSGGVSASESGSAASDSSQGTEPDGQEPEQPDASGSQTPEQAETGPAQSAEKPAASQKPAEKPAEKPAASQKPAEKPTEKPAESQKPVSSSSGEKPESTGSVDLAAFYDTLTTEIEFPSMNKLTDDEIDSFYSGLRDLKLKQCLVYMPMISFVGAEVALVEVSSGDDVQKVKDIFQARVDYQIQQGAFYPETIDAWENSTRIVSHGNTVMLVCMADECDQAVTAFNALFS